MPCSAALFEMIAIPITDAEFDSVSAAVAGALLFAHRNYEDKSLIGDIIDRIFRK